MASSLRSIQHRLVHVPASFFCLLSLYPFFFSFFFSVRFTFSFFFFFFFIFLFFFIEPRFRRVSFATLIAVDIKQIWDKSIVLWRGIVPTRRMKAERTELFRNFKCTISKGGEGERGELVTMRRRVIIFKMSQKLFRKWTFRFCLSFINYGIQFYSSFNWKQKTNSFFPFIPRSMLFDQK